MPGGDVQVRSGGLTGGAVLVRFGLTAQPCPVGRGGGDRDALEWNHFCTRLLRCACTWFLSPLKNFQIDLNKEILSSDVMLCLKGG